MLDRRSSSRSFDTACKRSARIRLYAIAALGAACSLLAPEREDFSSGDGSGSGNGGSNLGGALETPGGTGADAGTAQDPDAGAGNGTHLGGSAGFGNVPAEAGPDASSIGRSGGGQGAASTVGGAQDGAGQSSTGGASGQAGDAEPVAGAGGVAPCDASCVPTDTLLWFRADQGLAPLTDDGLVQSWTDANGVVARQDTADARPREVSELGHTLLEFDGNDSLVLPTGFGYFPGLTVFAVVSFAEDTPDACTGILHFWNQNVDHSDVEVGRHQSKLYYEAGRKGLYSTEFLSNAKGLVLLEVVHGPDLTARLFIDGAASDTRTEMPLPEVLSNRNVNSIGNNAYDECVPLRGWIGEILLYARALDPVERGRAERYLATKWSLAD